jgi:Type IV pilin-like G and H, putative
MVNSQNIRGISMKALLRHILLCLVLSTPALAEPTTTSQNQPSMIGTWRWTLSPIPAIFIFDNSGVLKALVEKTYGDYKYYEFSTANYNNLMSRIAGNSSELEPFLNYKLQSNILEVTIPNGSIQKNSLNFINNGRTVNFRTEGESEILVTFDKVSDSVDLPTNTESLTTVEGHFHGLNKLVALQVAQSDYWIQKRRFAKELQSLKIKSLPESDRSYRYELVKQSPRQSVIVAIPTQPNLRSYTLQLDRVGRRQQPFNGILCATDRPGEQPAPLPQFKNKGLTCPATTHEVDFNTAIRRSLLKVK